MKDQITGIIIKEAIEVSKEFGRGLSPAAFSRLLEIRINKLGRFNVERSKVFRPNYLGETLGDIKVDLIVDGVAVSIVATDCENQLKLHELRSKLLLVGLKKGLLIEINRRGPLKDYVSRVIIENREGGTL